MLSRKSSIFYAPPIYSSDDSSSLDLSFDEELEKESSSNFNNYYFSKVDNEFSSLETLKNKKEFYNNKKNQKLKIRSNNKSNSKWISLFSTFFDVHTENPGNMTLNEIELRCTFLDKCDETEIKMKRNHSTSDNTKQNLKHSRMKTFMNEYSTLKKKNLFSSNLLNKFRKFSKTKNLPANNLTKRQEVPRDSFQSQFLNILKQEIDKSEETHKRPKDLNNNYMHSNMKITESKTRIYQSEINSKYSSRRKSNLLEIYGIENATTIFSPEINQKKTDNNYESARGEMTPDEAENCKNILSNKFSYMIELDKYFANIKKSSSVDENKNKSKAYHKHLLDHRDAQKYFEYLGKVNKTLQESNDSDLSKVNKISNKVRTLCSVIDNLDQNRKFLI